jgi:capsular exopolysaccharide synthesis family protein
MALLADRMDHSLKTMDEVETRLKLPIIGSIPILNLEPKKESTLLIADYGSSFQIQKDFEEEQPFQEWNLGYDNLKDNLLLSIDGCPNPPCILGVTSCYPGEGVSTIAANLAQSLIKEGNGRVLLVDANLRHPSNHLIFDLALSPGLSDILFKEHENLPVIHTLPKQGLDVLTSGNREVQSLHLAESKAFNDFLERCKKDYSFVIIDMPPISEGSSAIRLASITDGVIFVVEFERVRRQVALRAKELLVKAQTNLLGVVLNKRKFYVPEWLYRTL